MHRFVLFTLDSETIRILDNQPAVSIQGTPPTRKSVPRLGSLTRRAAGEGRSVGVRRLRHVGTLGGSLTSGWLLRLSRTRGTHMPRPTLTR